MVNNYTIVYNEIYVCNIKYNSIYSDFNEPIVFNKYVYFLLLILFTQVDITMYNIFIVLIACITFLSLESYLTSKKLIDKTQYGIAICTLLQNGYFLLCMNTYKKCIHNVCVIHTVNLYINVLNANKVLFKIYTKFET